MIESLTKHKFSLRDVILMEESGVLGPETRVELLDGELIDMSPIYPPHAICVNNLTRLFIQNTSNDLIVSVQNPFYIADHTVLEPDLVVARSSEKLLKNELIKPIDTELLIEVSDSTYQQDKHKKLEVYAEAGVKEYWIVNIQSKQIEIHKEPKGKQYTSILIKNGAVSTTFGFSFEVLDVLAKE